MDSIHFFQLQVQPVLQTDFVLKAGLLVILLSGVIIYLTVLYRHKKNLMYVEKKLQEKRFNAELLKSRVEVQESTFTSVATELHDNVGQLISTALMQINMAERELKTVPATLSSAAESLNQSIIEIRSLSKSLNKDWLEQFDLEQNLDVEVSRLNKSGDILITVNFEEENIPLTTEEQFVLFRIIQEGIQNVVRHAGAALLVIHILQKKNSIKGKYLEIKLVDNGGGFDIHSQTPGLGLGHMRQRAESLGAQIHWNSGEKGTAVTIHLPI